MSAAKILYENNAVYTCVVLARELMYRGGRLTSTTTARLTQVAQPGQVAYARPNTHVYTEKLTKSKWRVSGSGLGNPAITFPSAMLRFIIINALSMDVIRLMVSNVN